MAEDVRPAAAPGRRLTTGHHTLDLWASASPVAVALLAFAGARNFPAASTVGIFLWCFGGGLVALGLAILVLRVHVPNHRDYYGGLALIALALFFFWAGSDLAGMRGFQFGAGTAPRLFATGLALVAAVVTVSGLLTTAPPIGGYAVRGPLFVTIAILSFGALIRGFSFHWGDQLIRVPAFGLIIASFVTFVVAACASRESRPVEAAIMAAALTAFCWLVFVKLLGLPFQLWPRF